jgi:TonB family protein
LLKPAPDAGSAPSGPVLGASGASLPEASAPSALWRVARITWAVGACFSLSLLVIGLARLQWLARTARPIVDGPWHETAADVASGYGLRRNIRLLLSTHPTLLVTWGVWRPAVLLPAGALDWSAERRQIVLAHELGHIRRGDWLAQMLAEALRSICWFNPLFWIAAARLRIESERACDDEVLEAGVPPATYASHLVELVRAARARRQSVLFGYPAPAMARASSFERRVTAMLNEQVERSRPTRRAKTIAASVAFAGALSLAGLGLAAQTFATLSGSVRDPMNQTIPQVTLILVNEQNEAKYEVKSDAAGRFEFVGLPAGSYLLQARYPGFTEFKGRLTVGTANVQRDLALAVGTVRETIIVAGDRTSPDAEPAAAVRAAKAPAPQAARPCNASGGGEIRPPMKVRDVKPRYPLYLRSAGTAGVVELSAKIQTDGSVGDLKESGAPAPAGLAEMAMDAVRQWQFTPTFLNCVPVDVVMNVKVTFELR